MFSSLEWIIEEVETDLVSKKIISVEVLEMCEFEELAERQSSSTWWCTDISSNEEIKCEGSDTSGIGSEVSGIDELR